ncbi:MAG: HAD hydrolase-like protein [Acidimicrobiia bacterium]|jgi:putative hydrolase of the HAD superfamily
MPGRPSAILLDVGGVFLLPSRIHIRSALERIGHDVTHDEVIDRAHYLSVRVFPMDLDGTEAMEPYWNDYLIEYARSVGVDESLVSEAVDHLRNEYVTGGLWSHLIEGSKEGLGRLVATGIPVGIVSNSDGTIEERLRDMNVLQVGSGAGIEVRCVIDSGTVGIEKPKPGIFDFALEALGLPPDDVWYVGDIPGFDVVAASRAGLRPILMDPFAVNTDFGTTTVPSLAGLVELLKS